MFSAMFGFGVQVRNRLVLERRSRTSNPEPNLNTN